MTRETSVEAAEDAGGQTPERRPMVSDELDPAAGSDFPFWLASRREVLASRWSADLRARLDDPDPALLSLIHQFYDLVLIVLTGCFGPFRSQFEPLLREVAELYGSVGAMRSLAAGEIIEEVQLLREALIRQLFTDPPGLRTPAMLLREILRLNRVVDRAVTYASVGHTDALFFALFQGTGAPKVLTEELQAEVEDQLAGIRSEADRLLGLLGRS